MMLTERKHFEQVLGLEQGIVVNYSSSSPLGSIDNYRYKNSVLGEVMLTDGHGNEVQEIGRIYIDRLLFGTGLNKGRDRAEIFDTEQYIMDMGVKVWDFKTDHWNKTLLNFFEHDLWEHDILYMHTVEILPEFRGMQIGEHVMKDAANNFESGCSLIVTDCIPLQHTFWAEKEGEWTEKMKYDELEKNKRKAKQKVIDYLKRTGFYYIPKVSKDHMFLCPARRNPNFDYIELG